MLVAGYIVSGTQDHILSGTNQTSACSRKYRIRNTGSYTIRNKPVLVAGDIVSGTQDHILSGTNQCL